jgi:hypothetical protein
MVGAISPHPSRPLPAGSEIHAFAEAAGREDGLVLVSFGSMPAFGTMLDVEDFTELALAFADLAPVRV